MLLEDAIKRNRVVVDRLIDQSWPFDAKAVLLGIEALKVWQAIVERYPRIASQFLPGETE